MGRDARIGRSPGVVQLVRATGQAVTATSPASDVAAPPISHEGASRNGSSAPEMHDQIDLISRARAGDRQAFAALYRAHVRTVFSYFAYRVKDPALAEDLTAEVFVRALRKIKDFRWQGVAFKGWLIRIAHNILVDHLKAAGQRMEVVGIDLTAAETKRAPASDLEALDRLDREALYRALSTLRNRYQEVLYLRFLQGLSTSETATAMDITESTLRVVQFRALKALLEALQREPGGLESRVAAVASGRLG